MVNQDRLYAAPQRAPFPWEQYPLVETLVRLPALSLKVVSRFGVGVRRAQPGQLVWLWLLLIIVNSFASMAEALVSLPSRAMPFRSYEPHPHYLPTFAFIMLLAGLWQQANRWREIRKGRFLWHTYSDGASPVEVVLYLLTPKWLREHPFPLTPGWWLAESRIGRFVDPVLWLAAGFTLERYDWILAYWILFAALCLAVDESITYHKAVTIYLDLIDSHITAGAVKQLNDAAGKRPSPSARAAGRSAGVIVESGLGKDIQRHLKVQKGTKQKEAKLPVTLLTTGLEEDTPALRVGIRDAIDGTE